MLPAHELPIREVTYEEAMARFKRLYLLEHLPHKPVNCRWWISDVASGALTHRSTTRCTMKGTVVEPEWRGFGYGEALLWHRIQVAQQVGYEVIDGYSRHPAWYYKQGFRFVRKLPNGNDLVECDLASLVPPEKYRWTP